jgi:hypothetical protein
VVTNSSGGLLSTVSLAPGLVTRGFPTVVDTIQTMWPRNPFDALPGGEAGVGGVLEYTLRSGDSGVELALPGTGTLGGGPPMRFLVAMGACWVTVVYVCVCVRRGKILRGSHCQT